MLVLTFGEQTTNQVKKISYVTRNNGNFAPFSLSYTYDNRGNIAKVTPNGRANQEAEYTYNALGQLTKEVNKDGTFNYSYDTYGNIRSVSGAESHTYTYGKTEWRDLLTAYDGGSITYQQNGNPVSYYNGTRWNFTWADGRQLTDAVSDDHTISYTYDANGVRNSKTVDGVKYNFYTSNGQVGRQSSDGKYWTFIYDNQGRPIVMRYDDATYYYVLNLQGDVIGLTNSTGDYVAKYAYDAWGKCISSSGTMDDINPLRYRGYYYDQETGFYYLGSRYYDPEIKRFINADVYLSTGQGFAGFNMFAYCLNNPINYTDNTGESVKSAVPPSTQDGYLPPKGGPRKGKDSHGNIGWVDKNGNIWVPQPDGSSGAHAHDKSQGGHWDVQRPDGKGYTNRYPGGKERAGKGKRPNIPQPKIWLIKDPGLYPNRTTQYPVVNAATPRIYDTPAIPSPGFSTSIPYELGSAVMFGAMVFIAIALMPITNGASLGLLGI